MEVTPVPNLLQMETLLPEAAIFINWLSGNVQGILALMIGFGALKLLLNTVTRTTNTNNTN
jgi:hypothetical protein